MTSKVELCIALNKAKRLKEWARVYVTLTPEEKEHFRRVFFLE